MESGEEGDSRSGTGGPRTCHSLKYRLLYTEPAPRTDNQPTNQSTQSATRESRWYEVQWFHRSGFCCTFILPPAIFSHSADLTFNDRQLAKRFQRVKTVNGLEILCFTHQFSTSF